MSIYNVGTGGGTGGGSTITYEKITLNPTFTLTNASGGGNWEKIVDGDINTSCTQFEVGGMAWIFGQLLISPGISIPELNKIKIKLGMATNAANHRPALDISVGNAGSFVIIWAKYGEQFPYTDPDQNIIALEIICPYSWSQLKIRLGDLGDYGTRCKLYNLEVFKVAISG